MAKLLTPITQFCGIPNLGSLQKIEYVPISYIYKASFEPIINPATYNWQQEIRFLRGGWMTMPVLHEKRRWEEKGNRNTQGPYYEQLVNGVVPALRPEVSGEFDRMAHLRYLLRLTDKKGKVWLLGDLDHPFQFRVIGTTGNKASDLNNYAIRFYSKTPHKMTGYVPVI